MSTADGEQENPLAVGLFSSFYQLERAADIESLIFSVQWSMLILRYGAFGAGGFGMFCGFLALKILLLMDAKQGFQQGVGVFHLQGG